MVIIPYALIVIAALAVGWFSVILTHRFPIEERALFAAPRCMRSGEKLNWYDQFPILGYLAQRGICRHCGKQLPWRFPLLEVLVVICFVAAWPRYENSATYIYIVKAFFIALMLVIGAIDLRHRAIFPVMIYLGSIVAIVVAIFGPEKGLLPDLGLSILGALFCGITFQLLYWLAIAIYRVRALGFGDVLLAFLIGLILGFPSAAAALFMGAFFNGVAALSVLVMGKKGRREFIPYGTTLCVATIMVLMFGDVVWRWGPLQLVGDLLIVIFAAVARILGLT